RRTPVALFGARRCSLARRPGEVLRGPSDRREGKLDCLSVQTDRALVRSRARDRGTAGRRGDATQASVNQDLGGGSTGFHVGLKGNSRRRMIWHVILYYHRSVTSGGHSVTIPEACCSYG